MSIDHVYCINLERRPDRKADVQKQFSIHGIENVEFFNATDGKLLAPDDLNISKPEWGCADSHIRVWRDIIEKGYETVLVFEDDAILLDGFLDELAILFEDLKNIEWDYINLGSIPNFRSEGSWESEFIQKGTSLLTHCYLIHATGAKKLGYINTDDLDYAIDTMIVNFPIKSYYSKKTLAKQFEGINPVSSILQGDIMFNRTVPTWFLLKCNIIYIAIIFLIYWFWFSK
jgi:GR25 family glycosyltransferase involved in LPS biosynthesis